MVGERSTIFIIRQQKFSLDEAIVREGILCWLFLVWRGTFTALHPSSSAFPASARRMNWGFGKPVTSAKLANASNSKSVILIVTSRNRRSHSPGDRYASDSWSFRSRPMHLDTFAGIGRGSGGWRRYSSWRVFCGVEREPSAVFDHAEAMLRIVDPQHERNRCV